MSLALFFRWNENDLSPTEEEEKNPVRVTIQGQGGVGGAGRCGLHCSISVPLRQVAASRLKVHVNSTVED